jgi:tetratricopeptide (TPR) repeat protein
MNKKLITGLLLLVSFAFSAQKLQLTEAATEYKNNFSKSWMMQPEQLSKNKSILLKAKEAIDESYTKQMSSSTLPLKLETKMYYYRGMIYLDFMMMAAMDKEVLSQVESIGENDLNEAAFGSLKKCIELDVKNQWKSDITRKVDGLRAMAINGGVKLFQDGDYKNSYEAFKGAVLMYDVISIPDTLAMVNAALAAEKMNSYNNAYTYYKMCADNNYGKGAEMYQSMIRVLNAPENADKDEDKILSVIEEGKNRFPKDYVLNVEEFNFWYSKGDNDKAQLALQKAIETDPTNKQLHFNIGVTYDNLSNKSHESKDHTKAFEYMDKAIIGYESAISIDGKYIDAYYNLGALFVNQSREMKGIAGDFDGEKYDKEMEKADLTMKKAIPHLEKVLTLEPNDKNTLTVLKTIYFNLDDMDSYNRVKKQLESL